MEIPRTRNECVCASSELTHTHPKSSGSVCVRHPPITPRRAHTEVRAARGGCVRVPDAQTHTLRFLPGGKRTEARREQSPYGNEFVLSVRSVRTAL